MKSQQAQRDADNKRMVTTARDAAIRAEHLWMRAKAAQERFDALVSRKSLDFKLDPSSTPKKLSGRVRTQGSIDWRP
jgi:hypothetical protein